MSITRHPDDSTLMSHAAGSLPGALAAVAAAHLTVCLRCRDEVAMMELMGGALLAGLPGAALQRPRPEAPEVEAVIGPEIGPERRRPGASSSGGSAEVPAPLARVIGTDLDALRWRWISRGLWRRRVAVAGGGQLCLLRGAPGVKVPEHGHKGSELTMVLRGTLIDSAGEYGPGDVCDLDEEVEHIPAAGAEGCICVVAQDHPARFHSWAVRLARPWHGM
jgi:putative transcriptional regulator